MAITLATVRHTATSALPVSVANNNCVQDALARLREALVCVDSLGVYYESEEAPAHLIELRQKLFNWIDEVSKN